MTDEQHKEVKRRYRSLVVNEWRNVKEVKALWGRIGYKKLDLTYIHIEMQTNFIMGKIINVFDLIFAHTCTHARTHTHAE